MKLTEKPQQQNNQSLCLAFRASIGRKSLVKIAICDTEAFYPLLDLVRGPFTKLERLPAIERFVRTVVLHDEIEMQITPDPYDPEVDFPFTEEERKAGGRLVITGMAPMLTDFAFFGERRQLAPTPDFDLSPSLIEIASRFANAGPAGPGNVYFKAHVDFLQRVLSLIKRGGGSVLLCGDFGQQVTETAQQYPESLFSKLDEDWQSFAKQIQAERLGLQVPPVLGIVLTRCSRRDAIPTVIKDLRDEWSDARRKVWLLIDALSSCRTVGEAREISRELSDASLLFSPNKNEIDSRPVRMLWELIASIGAGAFTAKISGADPVLGVAIGGVTQAARVAPGFLHEFGRTVFGRGAFDLANKVRKETAKVEFDALPQLLSDAEIRSLQSDT